MLGDFTDIGYYDKEDLPKEMDADFLLSMDRGLGEVEKALKQDYFTDALAAARFMDPATLYLELQEISAPFSQAVSPILRRATAATGDAAPTRRRSMNAVAALLVAVCVSVIAAMLWLSRFQA